MVVLNPLNLNPQTFDDIDMDWLTERSQYDHHIYGALRKKREEKRALEEALRNKKGSP